MSDTRVDHKTYAVGTIKIRKKTKPDKVITQTIMKPKLYLLIFFVLATDLCEAQQPVVLDTSMFDKIYQYIDLSLLDGWIFHEGNNLKWSAKDMDNTGWKKFSPNALSVKDADKSGRAEGWFRLRFKLDSSFSNIPFTMQLDKWMAKDVYIDGAYIASYGNTGINLKPYIEGECSSPINVSTVTPGNVHTMAVHVIDYISPLNPWALKGGFSVSVVGPDSQHNYFVKTKEFSVYFISYAVVCAVLCLLFFFLYFQNRSEKVLLLIALGMTFLFLQMIFTYVWATVSEISFLANGLTFIGSFIFGQLYFLFNVVILAKIFKKKIQPIFLLVIVLLAITPIVDIYISMPSYTDTVITALQLLVYGHLAISS